MQVSFTGIKNLYINKTTFQEFGSYISNDSKVKQGIKDRTNIKIKCDLTDDEYGYDLSEYKETLAKCRPCYQVNCFDRKNPQKFELLVYRQDVADKKGHVSMSDFLINDYDIMLDERQILPLFTFMAKLSKRIANIMPINAEEKFSANLVNKSVEEEAEKFIALY